jgi:cytochrome o ubiquinol oxidase subunit II
LLALTGCGPGILPSQGVVGKGNTTIMIDSLAIMLAIVVPTIVATLSFAWWFRSSNSRARHRPDFIYSGQIELVTWSIPLLTIMLLGGVAWRGSHDLDPARPLPSDEAPLKVQAVSLDWKWLFIYPDQGIATVNQLVVPAGVPVSYRLTSATVWNVFFVPQFGTMIYTMPRMTTRLNLQADRQGVYEGRSAHFSGDGFSGMEFKVQAVPPQQFAAWAQTAHGSGPALDGRTYAELAKPSSYVKPMTYSNVVPGLFDAIATGRAPERLQLPHNRPAPGTGT